MQITKDTVVTISYQVADAQGKLLEASPEPMAYLHGGYGNTFEKIEAALEGQQLLVGQGREPTAGVAARADLDAVAPAQVVDDVDAGGLGLTVGQLADPPLADGADPAGGVADARARPARQAR